MLRLQGAITAAFRCDLPCFGTFVRGDVASCRPCTSFNLEATDGWLFSVWQTAATPSRASTLTVVHFSRKMFRAYSSRCSFCVAVVATVGTTRRPPRTPRLRLRKVSKAKTRRCPRPLPPCLYWPPKDPPLRRSARVAGRGTPGARCARYNNFCSCVYVCISCIPQGHQLSPWNRRDE